MLDTVKIGPFDQLVYAPANAALVLGCSTETIRRCIAENIIGNVLIQDRERYPSARDVAEILLWRAAYPALDAYQAAVARHNSVMARHGALPRQS